VTDGMDIVDAIATAPTGAQDRPVDPVTIDSIEITES
jgi:cyclophilin family peptidyl-prolyl cis-trans isomerase